MILYLQHEVFGIYNCFCESSLCPLFLLTYLSFTTHCYYERVFPQTQNQGFLNTTRMYQKHEHCKPLAIVSLNILKPIAESRTCEKRYYPRKRELKATKSASPLALCLMTPWKPVPRPHPSLKQNGKKMILRSKYAKAEISLYIYQWLIR